MSRSRWRISALRSLTRGGQRGTVGGGLAGCQLRGMLHTMIAFLKAEVKVLALPTNGRCLEQALALH